VDPELVVRLFRDADAAPLTDLLHEAYAELGAAGLNYTAVDQGVETTRARAGAGRCWVVESGDRLVGTLTISLPPSAGLAMLTAAARQERRAWLNQVAVSPSFRSLGIATDLWRRGREWALAQGATSVGVDTAVDADHLVQLYAAWGFAGAETIHWAGKTYDSVVMTRPLGEQDT